MSLQAAIDSLQKDIEELQAIIPAKSPEQEMEAFCRLRALSVGRSMLLAAQAARADNVVRLNAFYQGARNRITREEQQG